MKVRIVIYSSYKLYNILKFFVCIVLNGYIMFLLKCYGGRVSDRFIIKKLGFYNYLNLNDEVMVDRGFIIGEELFSLYVGFNIFLFL